LLDGEWEVLLLLLLLLLLTALKKRPIYTRITYQ
jgi:hypothetical protein